MNWPRKKSLISSFESKQKRQFNQKELEKDSWNLIHRKINKQITSFELATEMMLLEKKYPGIGWADNAKEIFKEDLDRENVKKPINEGDDVEF